MSFFFNTQKKMSSASNTKKSLFKRSFSLSGEEKSVKSFKSFKSLHRMDGKSSKTSRGGGSHFRISTETLDKVTKRVVAPYAQIERKILKKTDHEAEKLLDLERFKFFLEDEVDLDNLLYETAVVMKVVTGSSGVNVYTVDPVKNELIFMSKEIQDATRHEINIPICLGRTIAAHVASTKEYIRVDDVERDIRFSEGTGFIEAQSVMCMPVLAPDGECFAVIELYKFTTGTYPDRDLQWALIVCGWAGAAVHQTKQRIAMQRRKHLDIEMQKLLQAYFSNKATLDSVITDLLAVVKVNIGAHRSSFFIIDRNRIGEHVIAEMWDDGWMNPLDESVTMTKKKVKVNFSTEKSPAALVAQTGVSLNLTDAYSDSRFTTEIDPTTGSVVRTLMAAPLFDKNGVMGVVQTINKTPGNQFTPEDEEVFNVFVSYCSLIVHFANMQHSMTHNSNFNIVLGELISRHLNPCRHDLEELFDQLDTIDLPPTFKTFEFHISEGNREHMPRLILSMFAEIIGEENYDQRTMVDFVLTIISCYRDNPYHNAEHAFHFTHTMYMILLTNRPFFEFFEITALMLAGLCHDVDHPGFNNNFLSLCNHPLASMYHSSILENHHYFVAQKVIEDKNLLSKYSEADRARIMSDIRYNILFTDLAAYFQVRAQLAPLIAEQSFKWSISHHRSLVKGILMTTSDLCGSCKPFVIAKASAEAVYEEFYNQGDLERKMGYTPLSMMDRKRSADQPAEQVQFISVVVMPCLVMLQSIFPDTKQLAENCRKTQDAWHEEIEMRGERLWRLEDSVPRPTNSSRPNLASTRS